MRERSCKKCNSSFVVRWDNSPQTFCSRPCSQAETNVKISNALYGKKKSYIARLNMSKSKRGKPWTEKQRSSIMKITLKKTQCVEGMDFCRFCKGLNQVETNSAGDCVHKAFLRATGFREQLDEKTYVDVSIPTYITH